MIENGIGEMKETISKSVTFDSNGRAMIVEKRRTNGTFQEFMELYQFPFDTQVSDIASLTSITSLVLGCPIHVYLVCVFVSTLLGMV